MKTNFKTEMNEELARKIVEITKASCNMDIWLRPNGKRTVKYVFYHAESLTSVLEARKFLKLGSMKKVIRDGRKSLEGKNFKFYSIERCKIVGYKKTVIPEKIQKTPIWKCF